MPHPRRDVSNLKSKVKRFLTVHRRNGWTLSRTVARAFMVPTLTVERHLDEFVRQGIVEKKRAVSVARMPYVYRLKCDVAVA